MQTLIIKVDTAEHAKQVTTILKKIKGVKSVAKEPAKYNWIEPSRPAGDDDIVQMIADCENSPLLAVAEAKANTYRKLSRWKKQKK